MHTPRDGPADRPSAPLGCRQHTKRRRFLTTAIPHLAARRERPTLVGKSAAKASAQQKRKASHSQRGGGGGGKRPKGSSGSGKSGGGKSGGRKQPRKAAAQVVGGKGTMYNLA